MAVSCGYQNQGVTGTAHDALLELPLSLIRTFTRHISAAGRTVGFGFTPNLLTTALAVTIGCALAG